MLKYMGPLLVVEDIAKSRRFYEELLGQTVQLDFGENVGFEGNFSIHAREHYQSLLGDAQQYPITRRSHNMEMYLETDALDDFLGRLEQAGVEFIHKIVEQPWRQKVMRLYDPDGHIIEIGETMEHLVARLQNEGMPVEAIAQATGLPAPYVDQLLQAASV